MIWIDRLALVWAAILWLIFALLANGSGRPETATDPEMFKAVLLLAGIPWLVARALLWAFTGQVGLRRRK